MTSHIKCDILFTWMVSEMIAELSKRMSLFLCKKEMPCMGYARKDVEKTKKIAKKFVRYQEGAELYSIGLTKFQELQ